MPWQFNVHEHEVRGEGLYFIESILAVFSLLDPHGRKLLAQHLPKGLSKRSIVVDNEELGIYQVQFNVVSSELLRNAMKEPEKYRDLLVRVASYVAYFVELSPNQQMDIINRTEHQVA